MSTSVRRENQISSFLAWHENRVNVTARRLLSRHVKPGEIRTVLDLGSGDGSRIVEIAGTDRIFGFDLSSGSAIEARTRGIKSVRADINAPPPFLPGSFDLAHSYGVTEYIPDIEKFLNRAVASVRIGGYLLLQIGIRDSMGSSYLEAQKAHGLGAYCEFANLAELRKYLLAESRNFQVLELAPIAWYFDTGRWRQRFERVARGHGTIWPIIDLAVRALGREPVGVYLLLKKTD